MTDLRQIDAKANPYFQNTIIRRYLIKAGLINRKGDIIHPSSLEISLGQPLKERKSRENVSKLLRNHLVEQEQQHKSRSQIDFLNKPVPIKKTKKSKPRNRSRSLSNTRRSVSPVNENQSLKRAKSAHHLSHDAEKRLVRRSANEKPPDKSKCRVIMIYYGAQTAINYDKSRFQKKGDEIIIMQQHCGGENLTVFKGFVKPNETFAFDSQRHVDYPFGLALYVNGLIDCRVSVCCEYKHKRNVPLGGPSGSFAISDVQRVKPCQSCRYERQRKKSKSKSKSKLTKSIVLEPSRYQKSVVPRLPIRHSSRSPDSHRIPTPPRALASPLEKDHKRSPILTDNRPTSSKVRTKRNSNIRSPHVSRTPTPTSKGIQEIDKKPIKSSIKRDSPVVPTSTNPTIQSPRISKTPTPPPAPTTTLRATKILPTSSEEDSKIPSTSPVDQNNDSDNYTSDFDEVNDDDNPKKNSRFGQPRISDPNSSDHDQGDSNIQSKSSFKILNASASSDDKKDFDRTKKLTGKENVINHSKTSGSSEDEVNKRFTGKLSEKTNTADDSRHSSSNTSKKDTEDDRQASPVDIFGTKHSTTKNNEHSSRMNQTLSSSSEDLFGIKRNSKEQNKKTEVFSKDWFEANNSDTSPKTTTWRNDTFFD